MTALERLAADVTGREMSQKDVSTQVFTLDYAITKTRTSNTIWTKINNWLTSAESPL